MSLTISKGQITERFDVSPTTGMTLFERIAAIISLATNFTALNGLWQMDG